MRQQSLACRAEMFVSCAPGNYTLRSGYGPLHNDPQCQSTHCELLQQEVLATIVVVSQHSLFCALLFNVHPKHSYKTQGTLDHTESAQRSLLFWKKERIGSHLHF